MHKIYKACICIIAYSFTLQAIEKSEIISSGENKELKIFYAPSFINQQAEKYSKYINELGESFSPFKKTQYCFLLATLQFHCDALLNIEGIHEDPIEAAIEIATDSVQKLKKIYTGKFEQKESDSLATFQTKIASLSLFYINQFRRLSDEEKDKAMQLDYGEYTIFPQPEDGFLDDIDLIKKDLNQKGEKISLLELLSDAQKMTEKMSREIYKAHEELGFLYPNSLYDYQTHKLLYATVMDGYTKAVYEYAQSLKNKYRIKKWVFAE